VLLTESWSGRRPQVQEGQKQEKEKKETEIARIGGEGKYYE
jgi:hypothetical protein